MKAAANQAPAISPIATGAPAESYSADKIAALSPNLNDWVSGAMAIVDAEGRILEASESLALWIGAPAQSMIGQSLVSAVGNRFPAWTTSIAGLLETHDPFAQLELAAATSSGGNAWVQLELAQHGNTRFVRFNSILPPLAELEEAAWNEHLQSDATRRHLFVRLLRAEAQLDNLVQRWPGVIFSQRADFTFNFASPRIEELTGLTLDQWRRQPQLFWQVVHEADGDELQQQLRSLTKTTPEITLTYRVRHNRTGRVAYVLEHRKALFSDSGLVLGYEGVWLDVTRQTIAEKRLSSAAWKESLAVLTMGLAHDFSNIMAGIHSLSEGFQAQVEKEHPFQEGLALIKRNSMQASQLVHRILNLHHGKLGERNYHDLNVLVSDTLDLMRKIVPRRIDVQMELAGQPLPLYVDAVEFRQVFINLALNAVDAMSGGGKLTFKTSWHNSLPSVPNLHGSVPRLPCICLTVADTGTGIPARHLASVFDPFFTTKPSNKGSGLGLYNAGLFVEKHHGGISVESIELNGTTFQIWFPQADFTETERLEIASDSRRHTVLLTGVAGRSLDSTAQFLRQNNYYVVTANSEEAATELLYSPDFQFSALMLLAGGRDALWTSVLSAVRTVKYPMKTILQVIGCNQDELDTQLLTRADLVLPTDLPPLEVVGRIKALLDAGS